MKPLISLDVFDTAIFRKVYNPLDIFTIVEDRVGLNFKALRIEAQNKAKRKNAYCTLTDIYKFLPKFDFKEEIRAEYLNCEVNPYILDLYLNPDYDFVFISDMYLSSSIIKSMLEKCGYKNPQVFVSCEYGVQKSDGRLFKRVEEILGRPIDKHIGDNYVIDIKGAQKAGIPEVEFIGPAIYDRKTIIPELSIPKMRKFLINSEFNKDLSIEEKIGYMFAPVALAFTKKVLEDANEFQTVFFNARDSFVFYIIARCILKTNKNIKYCRFSRKSCFIPSIDVSKNLRDKSNEFILSFLKLQKCRTLREFFKVFKLSEDRDCSEILNKYNIDIDTNLDFNLYRKKILEETATLCQDDIFELAVKERKNFLRYIERIGIKEDDVFVDLGYFGSMQAMIKRITDINLRGRYLCTLDTLQGYKGIKINKKSFLGVGFFGFHGGVVEMIFSEPKGTVYSYDETGHPVVSNDTKFRKEATKKILRGIIKGAEYLLKENVKINVEDCETVIERFLKFPSLEEASFANGDLFENGSYDNNESIVWFKEDLIKKGKLKDCYSRSYWKEAFKVLLSNHEYYRSLERMLK